MTHQAMMKDDAVAFVENFFEEVKSTLSSGQHLKLSGFGNFILRDKSSRPGRNPKTGEEIPVSARRVVTFKSGLKLKHRIEKI
jgi:integration host factor subunit alpha